MMMGIIYFPPLLMREQTTTWSIVANVVSGGRTGADAAPLVRTDGGGLWMCTMEKISLRTVEQIKLWRAIEALAEAGAATLYVPQCETRYAPNPKVGNQPIYNYSNVKHDDGAGFSDGSSYRQGSIECYIAAPAALRATTIELDFATSGAVIGGEHFSIRHPNMGWRRYLIARVFEAEQGSGRRRVEIRPPLREVITTSDSVDFYDVVCPMRLASPDSMRLPLDLRKWSAPSVSFIETFDVRS